MEVKGTNTRPEEKQRRSSSTGSGPDKSRESWRRSRTMVWLNLNRRSAQYRDEAGKGSCGRGQTGVRKR